MRFIRWFLVVVVASLLLVPAAAFAARGGDDHVSSGNIISHVITHYEHNGKNHPGGGPPPGGDPTPTPEPETVDHSTHFELLPGARASSLVNYVVEDPGIVGAVDAVVASFDAWEAVSGIDFTFDGTASVNVNAEVTAPNGTNTVSWALFIGNTKALAVTLLWIDDANLNGVWDDGEAIIETELIFNSRHTWAVAENSPNGKWFDIQNVGTHEAGHFVGLDDQDQWDDETMFFKAGSKETDKRSLEPGDIAGAVALYGP